MSSVIRPLLYTVRAKSNFSIRSVATRASDGTKWSRKQRLAAAGAGLGALGGVVYWTRPEHEKRFVRVTCGGVVRFFRTSFIGASITADYFWTLRGIPEEDPVYVEKQTEVHARSAQKILKGCLGNGGLYIKLGQGLVIMDHILPKPYIDTLRVLQDKCLDRQPKEVSQLFQEEFGKSIDEMFVEFDEKAIAAASIAQVFKAKTKDGANVAVKAQYIDLQDRFVGDIATLTVILNVAGWIYPDFNFAWVLNELKGTLEKELNFINEGKNSERCSKDLETLSFVYVPRVLWDYTSSRILTTEFIEGIKISDKELLLKNGFKLGDIDHKLFETFSEQIFYTGFVHADPHPGNVLVRKDAKNQAQLVILDHGLYEEVPDKVRESLRNLWKAMVLNDHRAMKKYSVELGIKAVDYRLFCIALGQRYIASADSSDIDSKFVRKFMAPQKARIKLTPEERAKLNIELSLLRSRSLEIFKSMPSKLMLVTRNINTIRSIARGHGDPINRYNVMARCATAGTFETKRNRGLVAGMRRFNERVEFEFKLWWGGVRSWWWKTFANALTFFLGNRFDIT